MVISRSPAGMKPDSTERSVVFPELAPPEMTMLIFPRTQAARNRSTRGPSVPSRRRSSLRNGSRENLRMVRTGPQNERGGMIAWTRFLEDPL
jgi:hypothetical protein